MTASKPAFPTSPDPRLPLNMQSSGMGMTQRQFYKSAALTGLLGNPAYTAGALGISTNAFARDAANIADALLSEDAEFEGRKE